jgi:hypothetical protein
MLIIRSVVAALPHNRLMISSLRLQTEDPSELSAPFKSGSLPNHQL